MKSLDQDHIISESLPSHCRVIAESYASHLRVILGNDSHISRESVGNDSLILWTSFEIDFVNFHWKAGLGPETIPKFSFFLHRIQVKT